MTHDPERDAGAPPGGQAHHGEPVERPDYAPPRRRGAPPAARFVLGAFLSAALLLVIATALPFVAGITIAGVALVAALVFMLFTAVRLDRRAASWASTTGVLTGVGLALLIYGACWVYVGRSLQH